MFLRDMGNWVKKIFENIFYVFNMILMISFKSTMYIFFKVLNQSKDFRT